MSADVFSRASVESQSRNFVFRQVPDFGCRVTLEFSEERKGTSARLQRYLALCREV